MIKKTGLGKGLDALFATTRLEDVETSTNPPVDSTEKVKDGEVIENIKVIDIEPNKTQPRKVFEEESLEELAQSIKEYGIIQPIVVRKRDNYYEIVTGERRWRACKKAGIKEIPAIVREYTEKKNSEVALIENLQRKDLNPIEKAHAIQNIMATNAWTQQEIADKLGMSRSAVANTLRLLNLDERVLKLVNEGKLTEGHCKALLAVEDKEKQYAMAMQLIEQGYRVREIDQKTNKKKSKRNTRTEAEYTQIESTFRNFFGAKVTLRAGKKSGKIIIQYANVDELERILGLVSKRK